MALPAALKFNRTQWVDIAYIAIIIVLAVGGVTLTFQNPMVTTFIMGSVLLLGLSRWHQPLDFLLVATGIVVGPTLEFFATANGLWTYPHPSVGMLPSWVFTLWPAFPLCLVRLTHTLLPNRTARLSAPKELLLGVGILGVEIPTLVLWGTDHALPVTLVTVVMLLPAAWLARSPQAALMLFISGVVGPVCETLPVTMGAWSYPTPFFLGMPMWLPTGYALFGFGVVRVAMGLEGLLASSPVGAPGTSPALAGSSH